MFLMSNFLITLLFITYVAIAIGVYLGMTHERPEGNSRLKWAFLSFLTAMFWLPMCGASASAAIALNGFDVDNDDDEDDGDEAGIEKAASPSG